MKRKGRGENQNKEETKIKWVNKEVNGKIREKKLKGQRRIADAKRSWDHKGRKRENEGTRI